MLLQAYKSSYSSPETVYSEGLSLPRISCANTKHIKEEKGRAFLNNSMKCAPATAGSPVKQRVSSFLHRSIQGSKTKKNLMLKILIFIYKKRSITISLVILPRSTKSSQDNPLTHHQCHWRVHYHSLQNKNKDTNKKTKACTDLPKKNGH